MAHRSGSSDTTEGIDWQPWGADAFARAAEQGRLVLLSGTARWCDASRTLRDSTLADPIVERLGRDKLVCVRFDADRMPHVRDRYNAGGWPIVALLTPSGEVLWSGSPSSAREIESMAERVLDAWDRRREEIDRELDHRQMAARSSRKRRATSGIVRREAADDVMTAAGQYFDARNGGFGEEPKFLPPDAVELLYAQGARHDNADWTQMARHTLDGVAAGELYDAVDGGFFRMARRADWTEPSTEKLLEANAWAVRAFALGAVIEQRDDWRRVVEDSIAWAENTLRLEDGLWCASQAADADYYAAADRRDRDAPPVDPVVLTDACAEWTGALAEAGARLRRPDWVEAAAGGLDRLLDDMAAPDGLFYHYRETDGSRGLPGLLSDVVEAGRACLTLAQATGDRAWVEHADRLAGVMRDAFWADDGGFEDLAHNGIERVGALRYRERPFETNAAAADFLVDLALATDQRSHRALAERTLAMLSPLAGRYGIAGATFALAVEHYFEPPTLLIVTGDGQRAAELRRAALSLPLPDRQVWSLPEGGAMGGRRVQDSGEPVVHVCGAQRWSSPIHEPAGLGEAVAATG